ncbi:MAG: NAD(P)-dependent oxidoreductase [Geminicoccaceae bacterium]|nr:NAD(P)-dependent oxidoreductase [Geminicoccaceae bacterium]
MARKMMQFVSLGHAMPAKREAELRKQDFDEIYARFEADAAGDQASRCEQCGVPFCQVHCPLHNNIPDWLKLTAEGRLEEAYELSSATNNMPEICGRICPQDRLCEGNCVLEQSGHRTVTIGAVEKYITETAFDRGWVKPPTPARQLDASVGVIGAGPAGLAAAEQLRRQGYRVTVYDRYDRAGGLLIYGIPGFKLEKPVVERRQRLLTEGGVEFVLGADIGGADGPTFADLREKHDALLIATGVYRARELGGLNVALEGIVPALDYLTAENRRDLGDRVEALESGRLDAKGRRVVVIGGGDTAMDCVRTAIRQGASSVRCLYRRDRENMPGSMREVQNAEEEGVEFVWLTAPEAFLGDSAVRAVRAVRMRLGTPDATGRQRPEPVEGSAHDIDADLVIEALGFDPEDVPAMFGEPALKVTRWGTVTVDWNSMMTSLDGVFAAGDIVRGASLVVWGVRDGRDAATSIHHYLQNRAAAGGDSSLALAS